MSIAASPGLARGEERRLDEAEEKAFLERWTSQLDDSETLEIAFKQEKRLKILRRPLESRGRIRLAGKKLLCEVFDKQGQLESAVRVTGDTVEMYYPRLKRLEVYDLKAPRAPAAAFPVFGADRETLQRDFEVQIFEQDGADSAAEADEDTPPRRRMVLRPRAEGGPIAEMVFIFGGEKLQEVRQEDRRGDRVRMVFQRFESGGDLEPEDLDLDVAPGTRRVRVVGSGRPEAPSAKGR